MASRFGRQFDAGIIAHPLHRGANFEPRLWQGLALFLDEQARKVLGLFLKPLRQKQEAIPTLAPGCCCPSGKGVARRRHGGIELAFIRNRGRRERLARRGIDDINRPRACHQLSIDEHFISVHGSLNSYINYTRSHARTLDSWAAFWAASGQTE